MTSDAFPQFPCGDPARDERMLDRYFADECSPEERAVVDAWFDANPGKRAIIADIRHVARFPLVAARSPDGAALRAAFRDRIRATGPLLEVQAGAEVGEDVFRVKRSWRGGPLRPRVRGETARMAGIGGVKKLFGSWPAMRLVPHSFPRAAGFGVALGAAILVLGLGAYVIQHRPRATLSTAESAAPLTEVATARGQRATIRLPDGSRVTLGVDSRMRYPRDFGKSSREILLDGEAYFDVVHDARVPFRVRTPHGVSEDVGTRFTVRVYVGESSTRVVVEEGLVSVGQGVTLAAGDLARLTVHAPPIVQHGVSLQTLLGWTHGQLNFVNTPLHEVLADVRRWYDVDVQLGDSALARRMVTASFGKEPLGQVLEGLARVVDARLERHGDTWVFVPKGRPVGA